MNVLNERIKKLRKSLDFTQQEFAEKIGTARNNIAGYETGKRSPSEAVISLICKTFNVNETWLRTGEGEMFSARSEADELAAMVDRLITGESADFKRRLVNALSTLKDEHWLILEQKLKEIVGMKDAVLAFAPAPTGQEWTVADASGQERTEPDIAAELAELKRQNQEKDKQLQELAAKVAAMEEEDALLGLTGGFSISPEESAGNLSPRAKNKPGGA